MGIVEYFAMGFFGVLLAVPTAGIVLAWVHIFRCEYCQHELVRGRRIKCR